MDTDTNDGAKAVFENLARSIFGSCGGVVEAASFLVQRGCARSTMPNETDIQRNRQRMDPLARFAGRYQSKCESEVPSFLNGDSVNYSFDDNVTFDDNISALSAHTLEEMAKNGPVLMPHRGRADEDSPFYNPPSPARTDSSSNSSREHGFRWSDSTTRKKNEPQQLRTFGDRKRRSGRSEWRREEPSNATEKFSIVNVAKADERL